MFEDSPEQVNKPNLLHCKNQNAAYFLCISPKCKSQAFICRQPDCACLKTRHIDCRMLSLEPFLKKLRIKKKNIPQSRKKPLQLLIKIYQDTIEQMSEDLDIINKRLEYAGLLDNQAQFMLLIDSFNFGAIKGQLTQKVEYQMRGLSKKTECCYLNDINIFWANQSINLKKMRESLLKMSELKMDNTLNISWDIKKVDEQTISTSGILQKINGNEATSKIISKQNIPQGTRFKKTFKLLRFKSQHQILVGIITHNARQTPSFWKDKQYIGLSFSGDLHSDEGCKQVSKVSLYQFMMEVDMDQQKISFYSQNSKLIAQKQFDKIFLKKRIYIIIGLTHLGDAIQMI